MRVADQRDPLTVGGEPSRLLDRKERLAAASAAAHLDAVEQANRVQDHRLVLGEDLGGVLVLLCSCDDVALR